MVVSLIGRGSWSIFKWDYDGDTNRQFRRKPNLNEINFHTCSQGQGQDMIIFYKMKKKTCAECINQESQKHDCKISHENTLHIW